MSGLDGTPMPAYDDIVAPADAWDLVHFLRVLQVNRRGKESDILKAAGGTIPPYVEKSSGTLLKQSGTGANSGGNE